MMDWSMQTSSCWTTNVVMPLLRPPSCPLGSSSGFLVLQAQIAQFPSPAGLSSPPFPIPGTNYKGSCHQDTAAVPEEID